MENSITNLLSFLGLCINSIGLCCNFVIMLGAIFAFWQVRAARDALKAQMQLRVIDEWRDPNVYKSMAYISNLRRQWKAHPVHEWPGLAENWVREFSPGGNNEASPERIEAWQMRRTASQFLSKMGSLIQRGFLDQEIFFGIDPEVGRQLAVLIPIENAIREYWLEKESKPLADWDQPFPKWEFDYLWRKYQQWFWTKGYKLKHPVSIHLYDKHQLRDEPKNEIG